MRRLRVAPSLAISASAFVALAALAVACGDDDNAPAANLDGGGRGEGGISEGGTFEGGVSDDDAGAFTIVDVPDVPCGAASQKGTTIYPASETYEPIVSLSALGARRLAKKGGGFVLLDADGSNPSASAIGTSRSVAALDDKTIAAVSSADGLPTLALHDATGAVIASGLRAHDTAPFGITVGGRDGAGLAVWGSQQGVYARGVASTNFLGSTFAIAAATEVNGFAVSIARNSVGVFGVAFSGSAIDGPDARLSFVRTTSSSLIATGYNLEKGTTPRRVVQLAPREGGWALLFDYAGVAHLALLKDDGQLDGPVLRLAGTLGGYGLATSGGELGVLAFRSATATAPDGGAPDAGDAGDGGSGGGGVGGLRAHPAFRPLDPKGAALGGWQCFGDGVDALGGPQAAILGEDNGYAIAYPMANGDVVYARVDRRGN